MRVVVLAEVADPDNLGEIEYYSTVRVRRRIPGIQEVPRSLLVLPMPVT
jgi:hypothetical protein